MPKTMGNIKSAPESNENETLSKFSHFENEDVLFWIRSLQKAFPLGYITLVDLDKIFKDLFPFGSCSFFTKQLFRTINIGNTQKIDFNEIFIAFSILTKGSKYEKLRWIFRFYDLDNDGVVSKKEIHKVAQAIYDMTGYFFDVKIDVRVVVDDLFESLNNESGFLSFEDFINLASEKPEIIQKLCFITDLNK